MTLLEKMRDAVENVPGNYRTLMVVEISMIRDAIKLIERLEKEAKVVVNTGEWISVNDALPKTTETTLICTDRGAVCVSKFSAEFGRWTSPAGRHAMYWQPMPKPKIDV